MKTFELGPGLKVDLDVLVESRLLVQGNSGAGKSRTLRRILEQTHGAIQHMVIDPEGEFATLREKYDYVLAGAGGETSAHPRTAALLAERLLELGASAILDIFELKPHQRQEFVQKFCDALVNAPKKLWHPVLVVIDEAHVYAPQGKDSESASAVIDLATRGRKRGFCTILATQRLSKLHKDAAEVKNKLIGGTSLDLDMKRAADELGLDKAGMLALRDLEPGEFWAFGPALSRAPTKVKIGPVATAHPTAGTKLTAPTPPATAKIKALLPKLADLPAEAEERSKSLQDLQRDNADLKRKLTIAQKAQPAPAKPADPKVIQLPVLEKKQLEQLHALEGKLTAAAGELGGYVEGLRARLTEVSPHINAIRTPFVIPPAGEAEEHWKHCRSTLETQ